jgi:hypothetical protein
VPTKQSSELQQTENLTIACISRNVSSSEVEDSVSDKPGNSITAEVKYLLPHFPN